MSRVVFITYGTNDFEWTLRRICRAANETGWFSDVHSLGPGDIPAGYQKSLQSILAARRGGGYWIWKPIIIREIARQLDDDDFLFYVDAGCHINPFGDIDRYKLLLKTADSGSFAFQTTFTESNWTHPDVFSHFGVSDPDPLRASGHYMATVLPFRICDKSRELIDRVADVVDNAPHLFTDLPLGPHHPIDFKEHRHDQSIWSVARKLHGSAVIPDETWSSDWDSIRHVPIQARRIRYKPPRRSVLRDAVRLLFRRNK